MTTPLYPTFRKRVNDAIDQIMTRQITPWAFLNTGHPFRIKRFDGRQISYEGVKFEGSPRDVFWSRYIEPFLEDICISEINAAVSMAHERGVEGKLLLSELEDLLKGGCLRVYRRMADIDRRLRGEGFPERVQLRPIKREAAATNHFIEERISAELAMWKSKPRSRTWYKDRTTQWIIGIIVTVAAALISLLA